MALTKINTNLIAVNTIAASNIADNALDATKIASNSILTRHIDDDQVTGDQLADNITIAGTLTSTGVLTANAGVVIDNITIDGTEIDLSSGALTIDVAGSITLDSDTGVLDFSDGGTNIGRFENASSDFKIESRVQDKDIVFVGNDGGTGVEAMRIDMSAGGFVGINTDTPLRELDARDGDGVTSLGVGNNAAYVARSQSGTHAPALKFMASDGTLDSPTDSANGDYLGAIGFTGYHTNGYYTGAQIDAVLTGTNGTSDMPSALRFLTSADGSATPTEHLRIASDGAVKHSNGEAGRFYWTKQVAFSASQTQNITFHLSGGNVYGQVRVHMTGDYGNVNAIGSYEKMWSWGYNTSNTSNYGAGGAGTEVFSSGSTESVLTYGSMSKTNNTTVIIPITNGNGSYTVQAFIYVEVTGAVGGIDYIDMT